MFNSGMYQLVVLLLTLVIAGQLASRGLPEGMLDLNLKVQTGSRIESAPKSATVTKTEESRKQDEQDRSISRHQPRVNLWYVGQ
jgi:hypothetical protein